MLRLAYETLELADLDHQRLVIYLLADTATAVGSTASPVASLAICARSQLRPSAPTRPVTRHRGLPTGGSCPWRLY
jgi:hypothetical protein